jgi:hypothetical protein
MMRKPRNFAKSYNFFLFVLLGILFSGCSAKAPLHPQPVFENQKKQRVIALEHLLLSLSEDVDQKEANMLAKDSITYAYTLSQKYELVWPPLLHNTLVNMGLKDRGLCYQWADDLLAHLLLGTYQSFDFYLGVSSPGRFFEHNTLVVSAKRAGFQQGVVLDPWRDSGKLFFIRVNDDSKYKWKQRDGN